MAIREDIVQSAVIFLQDPSVANAPLDKRIAFLQSKNLTQEEVDAALARTGENGGPQPPAGNFGYQGQGGQQQQMVRQQYPPQYGYGGYNGGYWQPPPPPEPPRRDWRDYFIMATVMSGLGYGVYFIVKRYIVPLIAPPTPPQLEQDKAAVDESFARAFAMIDKLSEDTEAIKSSEESRKEKVDSALADMEATVSQMKDSARRRDDDSRRINDEIRALQAMIPKAMKAQEENADARLKELNTELKSLKTLISNRMSGAGVAGAAVQRPGSASNASNPLVPQQGAPGVGGSTAKVAAEGDAAGLAGAVPASEVPATGTPDRSNTTSPYGRFGSKGGIPSWQLAASSKKDTTESGTAVDAEGAGAGASSNAAAS